MPNLLARVVARQLGWSERVHTEHEQASCAEVVGGEGRGAESNWAQAAGAGEYLEKKLQVLLLSSTNCKRFFPLALSLSLWRKVNNDFQAPPESRQQFFYCAAGVH